MADLPSMPVFDSTLTYDQLFIDLLKNLPDELCETLRLGALPHFLDEGLAKVLFPANPEAGLERVMSFPFVTVVNEERLEYHASTRGLLLKNWQTDDPKLYRQLNGKLADEFLRRLETATDNSMQFAVEWVYHSVAANPESGMRSMSNLFHELLETRELGAADRLVSLVSEQQPWLGQQSAWLEYFQAALMFQRFQPVEMAALEELARRPLTMVRGAPSDSGIFLSGRTIVQKAMKDKALKDKALKDKALKKKGGHAEASSVDAGLNLENYANTVQAANILENSLLTGCVRRLQGRVALANQQWSDGRRYLKEALLIFNHLESYEEQALTHLELGNRYYVQAIASGGIQAEQPSLDSRMGSFLFKFSRLPLRAYRWLAEHFDPLPDLYDGNYQNWIVLSLLRAARNHYEAAGRLFKKLGNQRGCLETDFYIGRIMLVLGYTGNSTRRCNKAKQRPLAATSPYYLARLDLIVAQALIRHGHLDEARRMLENCLAIFTRYDDWRLVLDAATALGTVLEQLHDWPALLAVTEQGLDAARRTSNPLAETRLASRLDWYSDNKEMEPAERLKARELRETVTCLAFIDRFPGPVRQSFTRLANWLAYPFVFLFVLSLIGASGVFLQFIEGELRMRQGPVDWSQGGGLLLYLALPVLMIWGYYVIYVVIGQIAAAFLSFSMVDETQPETWSVEQTGISKMDTGNMERRLDWEDVKHLVIDNRALYCVPIISSSRLFLRPMLGAQSMHEPLVLPASIFRYGALQGALEKRLSNRVVKFELSILRTRWLWISLAVGLGVALAVVFGAGWYGCYGQSLQAMAGSECQPENRLYVQPLVQGGLFFASLMFGVVTWARWQRANLQVKRALEE